MCSLTCTKLPKARDRVGLCCFLRDNGNIDAEATVARFSDDQLWYCYAAGAEYHDMDWLTERLPTGSDIKITSLKKAGEPFGLTYFGMYAIESMRMEKGYGPWKGDFITEFNSMEAGVGRIVDLSKDFPGKAGLERQITLGNCHERVHIAIDSTTAPAHASEAVFDGDRPVSKITSAAWVYRTEMNLAMAYVDPAHADIGTDLSVLLIGQRIAATTVESCIYNAAHAIPRGQND